MITKMSIINKKIFLLLIILGYLNSMGFPSDYENDPNVITEREGQLWLLADSGWYHHNDEASVRHDIEGYGKYLDKCIDPSVDVSDVSVSYGTGFSTSDCYVYAGMYLGSLDYAKTQSWYSQDDSSASKSKTNDPNINEIIDSTNNIITSIDYKRVK